MLFWAIMKEDWWDLNWMWMKIRLWPIVSCPFKKKKKKEAPQSPRLTTSPNKSLLSSFLRFIFPPHSFLCFISCTVILSTKRCCSRGIRAVSSTLWRLAVSCSPWGMRRPRLSFRQIWGHCRRSGTVSTVCCPKDWSSPRL